MKTLEPPIHYNPDLTQIINGEEVMSPSPKTLHQKVSVRLIWHLFKHVNELELGQLFHAPYDVILDDDFNRLQPDIVFISNQNEEIILDWVKGVPDLVIEIVSPGSKTMDTVVKKRVYERHGVPEYWNVFPEKVCIEVYTLVNGTYTLFGSFSDEEHVRSSVLDGLSFPVNFIVK